jgi:L-seryl-tRNA(Ser) seleniumtransferase
VRSHSEVVGTGGPRPPAVGRLLQHPDVAVLAARHGRAATAAAVRALVAEVRAGRLAVGDERGLAERVAQLLDASPRQLRRVINGTGVVIHTNLGRAPLAARAAARAAALAVGYTNLELDLRTGRRGDRHSLLADILRRLVGAEDAMVVNNGAAAVLLALTALCRGREVLVSRGEAIEIGGGFRIPDILRLSGAKLVEVGTTNRTRVPDYERACTPRTAAFLRVHQSNFRITGFTERPRLSELAAAAHGMGVHLLEDVGSGLLPPAPPGAAHEARLGRSWKEGADLILCSGDKLLGASQAGLALGRAELVERLRRHPLARALRPDKLQLAALEETLRCIEEPGGLELVPVWAMLRAEPRRLRRRSEAWAEQLRRIGLPAEVTSTEGAVGGGTTPGDQLPSFGIHIPCPQPGAVRRRLLAAETAVLCLERPGGIVIDARCVLPGEDDDLIAALAAALGPAT